MTQPRPRRQPARAVVVAIHNASRVALVMAVVAVALVGADAAVAVSRTAHPATPASVTAPVLSATVDSDPVIAAAGTTPPATLSNRAQRQTERSAAQAALAKALSDALAKSSVHTIARNSSKRYGASIFDTYGTKSGGMQHLSIYGGNILVRVVGPITYFTGDRRGLTHFFGFTADEVAVLHHQWLTLTSGQAGYTGTTIGITLPSILRLDRIAGPLQLLAQRTRDGVDVIGVRGYAGGKTFGKHAVATMWISTDSDPLPVEFVVKSRLKQSTQTFSGWDDPIHVVRPTNVFGAKTLAG
ncbi:MAG TPA: hypothetical protein VHC43_16995 [Mycobacteriales bacterium]|nr:hypothetical protein [Mycobacteriales bacterium]